MVVRSFLIAVAAFFFVLTVQLSAMAGSFTDVPPNHWAYDAVTYLSRQYAALDSPQISAISGYPDGTFKGVQPATRSEMASAVARILAKVDAERASKEDLELINKLSREFRGELAQLGVKLQRADSGLSVMERDLGGWRLSGELRFDATFGANEANIGWYEDEKRVLSGKNEFDLNRYRLYISKRIDERSLFVARLGTPERVPNDGTKAVFWEQYFVTTYLPHGVRFSFGRMEYDLEKYLGFYVSENDGWDFNLTRHMFVFEKDWGMINLKFLLGRNFDNTWVQTPRLPEAFLVAALADFQFSERLRVSLAAYRNIIDKDIVLMGMEADMGLTLYGAWATYALTPSIELKGMYYRQIQGDTWAMLYSGVLYGATSYKDSADAWKVILNVKQPALKYTSLWLEYGKMDNNFWVFTSPYADFGVDLFYNKKLLFNTRTSTITGGRAEQQWNDKLSTFFRYYQIDHDTPGVDKAKEWSVGVAYQYSPAIKFELAYDEIDFGFNVLPINGLRNGSDNVVRLRTFVTF